MKLAVCSWRLARSTQKGIFYCLLLTAICQLACSIPNLEKPQCTEARNAVKRFYSFHFGSDMHPSPENLKAREQFLTNDLVKVLSASTERSNDYFTATDNYPKAFRVGECRSDSDERATLQVLLLWRDDTASDQKEVFVETVLVGDTWLINKISN